MSDLRRALLTLTATSIGIPFWKNLWFHYLKEVKDVQAHPTWYMLFNKVWKEQEA